MPPSEKRIARPSNPFFVYRKIWWEVHRDILTKDNVQIPQTEISRWVATCWGKLSDVEKATFSRMAEEEKREHSVKYPDYKFAPRRQKQGKQDNWKAWRELLPNASSALVNFPQNPGNDSSHDSECLSGHKDSDNLECALGQLMCGGHVLPQPPLACFSVHGTIIHGNATDTSGSASSNQDQDQLSDGQMALQIGSLAAADDGHTSATGGTSSQSIWDELMDALQDTESHPASVWSEEFFGHLPSASTSSENSSLLPFACYPGIPDSGLLSPQIGAATGSTQQTAPTSNVPVDPYLNREENESEILPDCDFGTLFGLRELTFDFDSIEAYFKTSEY